MDGTVQVTRGPDLTTAALHGLLRLRVDVFVVEQRCAYAELDGRDLDAGTVHLVIGPAEAPEA
jgi:ElaA protein